MVTTTFTVPGASDIAGPVMQVSDSELATVTCSHVTEPTDTDTDSLAASLETLEANPVPLIVIRVPPVTGPTPGTTTDTTGGNCNLGWATEMFENTATSAVGLTSAKTGFAHPGVKENAREARPATVALSTAGANAVQVTEVVEVKATEEHSIPPATVALTSITAACGGKCLPDKVKRMGPPGTGAIIGDIGETEVRLGAYTRNSEAGGPETLPQPEAWLIVTGAAGTGSTDAGAVTVHST